MKKNRFPKIEAFYVLNNKLWFLCSGYNILGSVDCESFDIEWRVIPFEDNHGMFYGDIIGNSEKLYIVPGSANSIVIYDINTQIFKKIDRNNDKIWKYCKAILIGGKVYAIPRDDIFLCIDEQTDDPIGSWLSEKINGLSFYYAVKTKVGFIAASVSHGGFLYVDFENEIITWKWEKEFPILPKETFGYGFDINENKLVVHKYEDKEILLIDLSDNIILYKSSTRYTYPAYVHYLQDDFIIIDYYYHNEIDIYNNKLQLLCSMETESTAAVKYGLVEMFGAWCCTEKDKVVYYNNCSGELRIYDSLKNNIYKSFFIEIPTDVIVQDLKYVNCNIMFYEDGLTDLNVYLHLLKGEKNE